MDISQKQTELLDLLEIQAIETRYTASISPENRAQRSFLRRLPSELLLSKEYDERKAIGDILAGNIRKQFKLNSTYNRRDTQGFTYEIRSQSGTIEDLFDNELLKCCSFYPSGRRKSDAPLLLVDPSIALLHMNRTNEKISSQKISTAITFFGYLPTGKKVLVVDGIEGEGMHLPHGWVHDYFRSNERFALENRCEYIVYGTKATNKTPQKAISKLRHYITPRLEPFHDMIGKEGAFSFIESYKANSIRMESFVSLGEKPADIYCGLHYRLTKVI